MLLIITIENQRFTSEKIFSPFGNFCSHKGDLYKILATPFLILFDSFILVV